MQNADEISEISQWRHVTPFACNLLDGVTVLPFFPVITVTLPITRDGKSKQLTAAFFFVYIY